MKLDTVEDIAALEDESRAAASSEYQAWSLLQADGRGDDFLFANGEAFPELLATRIYNVGHLFGPDENKLLAERDAKAVVARRLGHAMETEIWDKGLPVSQGDAASMTEGNLAALALSNKQFEADPGEAITQYARAILDWERTESHYSVVHFHEFTLESRLKAIRAGTTVIKSQKDFDDTTAGTAFDRAKLRMFEEAEKAPDDHMKALRALILFHPDRDVRLTFYRWTAEERAPFEIAIANVDSRFAHKDWDERMWRALVWAHERSFLLDSAIDAFRAIKENPGKTLITVFAIIGLQAIPGVDVAVDVILLIEFGWGILDTALNLYEVFKKAAHATTVVEMEHAAAAMGGAIGGAAAELLMFAATWGISKFAAKAMKYRAGKKFLTDNHGSLEAKKALAAARGDVAEAEATLAKEHAEGLAREKRERIAAEQRHQAELAEKQRLREEAAENQRKAEAQRKADEAAKREADEAAHKTEARRKADEAAKKKADEAAKKEADEAARKAEAQRKRVADEAAAKAEAKRKQDLADKAAADKRAADRKAVDDRKAKAKAKKDAEAAKRDPKSPTFEPRSPAEQLAIKKGMKPAPDGYNWRTIKVDGEDVPVIARSGRRGAKMFGPASNSTSKT